MHIMFNSYVFITQCHIVTLGLSGGDIAGIAIGVLAVLSIISLVIVVVYKIRTQNQ